MSARRWVEFLVAGVVVLRLLQRFLARRRLRPRIGEGFRCPSCGVHRLVVMDGLALPDGTDLEAIACRRCGFRGVALLGEEHRGYPMEPLDWGRLSTALRRCPTPRERVCGCPVHERFAADGIRHVPHQVRAGFRVEAERIVEHRAT